MMKRIGGCPKTTSYNSKTFNLLNCGFNIIDYQLFRMATHPNTPLFLRYPTHLQ